jgi:hypothetical protein
MGWSCWKETDTRKGSVLRECASVNGIPCVKEMQMGRHLVRSWRPWAQWEEGIFVVANVVTKSNLSNQILNLKANS